MSPAPSSLKAYTAPFAVYMALMIAADLLPISMKYWVYPVQTILCGMLIIRFWRVYSLGIPKKAGFTFVVAVFVLFLWISPQLFFGFPKRFNGFNPDLFKSQPALYFTLITLRFARLVLVVPLMEEIFWRGFLLRYLVREDFEAVPFGTITRFSFAIVTIGFCIEHNPPDWAAALITGMLYNLIAWRTRSLSSCVMAHAVTNLMLGIYVMYTGQWGFW